MGELEKAVLVPEVKLNRISKETTKIYRYDPNKIAEDYRRLEEQCRTLKTLAENQAFNMINFGKVLSEIREAETFRSCSKMVCGIEVGYTDFEKFCKEVLEISKTTAQNAIGLYENFSFDEDGKIEIKPEYAGYTVSQLVELTSVPEEERTRFTPKMTVKEIRERKKEIKKPSAAPKEIGSGSTERKIPTSELRELTDGEAQEIVMDFLRGSYSVPLKEICLSDDPDYIKRDKLFEFFKKYGCSGFPIDYSGMTVSKFVKNGVHTAGKKIGWLEILDLYTEFFEESEKEGDPKETEVKIPTSEFMELRVSEGTKDILQALSNEFNSTPQTVAEFALDYYVNFMNWLRDHGGLGDRKIDFEEYLKKRK